MPVNLRTGQRLWERARRVLPGGVSSNVKMDEQPQPMFFTRAEGCRLHDADGNVYIDYTCGYGPVILGHCYPQVDLAAREGQQVGTVFALSTEREALWTRVDKATFLTQNEKRAAACPRA